MLASATGVRAQETLPEEPAISTFAGDGTGGSNDGSTANARFITPFGIAAGADGTVYVSDFSSQVISRITPSGRVERVAGTFEPIAGTIYGQGGLINGPVATARFNGPAALAVLPDRSLIVADSRNACIRRISQDLVTTFAGVCGSAGRADGTSATATFTAPMGLAVARDGTVYVADYRVGVRIVGTDGSVRTMTDGGRADVTGICRNDAFGGTAMALVGPSGITIDDPKATGRVVRTFPADSPQLLQGVRTLGVPFACAFTSADDFLYSDDRTQTIRLFHISSTPISSSQRAIAGIPRDDDPSNDDGGFRDGPAGVSLWHVPLDLASFGGNVLVADGGNHRIRRISGFDARAFDSPIDAPPPNALRIAYIGNSVAWWNSSAQSTTGKFLERDVVAQSHRPARVDTYLLLGVTPKTAKSFLDEQVSPLGYDVAILLINTFWITDDWSTSRFVAEAPVWQPKFESELTALRDSAKQKGVRLVVVAQPFGWENSPTDSYLEVIDDFLDQDYHSRFALLDQSISRVFPDHLSLLPLLQRESTSADGHPIFGGEDGHPSLAGRRLIAEEIERYLIAHDIGAPASSVPSHPH